MIFWIKGLKSSLIHCVKNVRIQENTDQKNSVFGHFSHSDFLQNFSEVKLIYQFGTKMTENYYLKAYSEL